jgi:hypothetical protein
MGVNKSVLIVIFCLVVVVSAFSAETFFAEYSRGVVTRLTRTEKECFVERKKKNIVATKKCDDFFIKHQDMFKNPPIILDGVGEHKKVGKLAVKYKGKEWSIDTQVIDFELCDMDDKCRTPKASSQGAAAKDMLQIADDAGL